MYIADEKNTVRDQLIKIIEAFIEQPGQEEANQVLHSIYLKFNNEFDLLSLKNLVFISIVKNLTPHYVQSDAQWLALLKSQLQGQIPYWNTYAFKRNLVELLKEDASQAYRTLKELLPLMTGYNSSNIPDDVLKARENLLGLLHKLCRKQLLPITLPELIVSYASHLLLDMPDNISKPFAIDRFSELGLTTEQISDVYLTYIEGLLQKLEGKTVLFVDIHLLPEGFVLNLR